MSITHNEGRTFEGLSLDELEESLRIAPADLPREFIEYLVAHGRATGDAGASLGELGLDWEAIRRVGEGASSPERAVGSMIAAAYAAVRDRAGGVDFPPGATRGQAPPAAPERPAVASPSAPPTAPSSETLTLVPPPPRPHVEDQAPPTTSVTAPAGPAVTQPPTPMPPPPRPWAAPPTEQTQTVADPTAATNTGLLAPPLPAPTVIDEPPRDVADADDLTPTKTRHSRLGHPRLWTVSTWVRNIGAIMILFVAWQLWGTAIAQHHEQDSLRHQFQTAVASHHHVATSKAGPVLVAATAKLPQPAEGTVIARIQIPKIGVDQYVVMGTAESDLDKGPGHYIGTALPGQAGNVAIAGHRTTQGAPFNRLGDLAKSDKIILTTTSGEVLTYVVSGTPVAVSPSDVAVLNDYGDNRVTLTTCNPEYSATQRLIVVGELQRQAAQPVTKAKPVAYHIVNPATASWNWSIFPGVLLIVGLLVLLGIFNRRLAAWYGRFGKWLILVPVWAAGLYLLFGALTSFFPPSI